jgi:phage tail-like protein
MSGTATGTRRDPLLGYNFQVSLLDSRSALGGALAAVTISAVSLTPVAGFSECSGLEGTLETQDHQEGGRNGAVLRFPTRVKWSNLTLRRGMGRGLDLWTWFDGFVNGTGTRRDGVITLQDESHVPRIVWGFRRGLPVKYSGPTLNAAQSAVAVETLEIAHEGLFLIPGAAPLAQAARAALDLLR